MLHDPRFWYTAFVSKVYDADTITVNVDVGFGISVTQRLRLLGINAPEMRGPDKAAGTISRDWLRHEILNTDILVNTQSDKKGKYGRYLATIYKALGFSVEEGWEIVSLNTQMVSLGLAIAKEY